MYLELRREFKEDYMQVAESNVGLAYRIVKIIWSLEGGPVLEVGVWKEAFQMTVNLDAQKQWTGLA